jgi:ferrous iron transport protein B
MSTTTHCHAPATPAIREGVRTIVLAGNPNVGKSVVFNALTGTYVDVSNFPGTTVELMRGSARRDRRRGHPWRLRRLLLQRRGARRPRRHHGGGRRRQRRRCGAPRARPLPHAATRGHGQADGRRAQHGRRGPPRGVGIDRDLLSDLLGVPVVETVAVRNQGIDELKAALAKARTGTATTSSMRELVQMAARVGCGSEALLVLEADETVASDTA